MTGIVTWCNRPQMAPTCGGHQEMADRGETGSLVGLQPALLAALRQSTVRNLNAEDMCSVASCRL